MPITFDALCALVGRLYIESQHQITQFREQVRALEARLEKAEADRDEAVRALAGQARGRIEESAR